MMFFFIDLPIIIYFFEFNVDKQLIHNIHFMCLITLLYYKKHEQRKQLIDNLRSYKLLLLKDIELLLH